MKAILLLTALPMLFPCVPAQANVFVGFEDLATPPALTSYMSLSEANGGSRVVGGILWDERLRVFGDQARSGGDPAFPWHGIPHGPHFFISNEFDVGDGDGIVLETSQVLTGAWFGQLSYYGEYQYPLTLTVQALKGAEVLGEVTLELPENHGFDPLPMEHLDASAFLSLTGITGYRIHQSLINPGSAYWTADDFQFATVPESAHVALLSASGLTALAITRERRRRAAARQVETRRDPRP